MPELAQQTQKLIQKYQDWYQSQKTKEGTAKIHVDEVASKVAAFYERIRGVVDWREEHLMRRAAIERILKRRLLLQKSGNELAAPFVNELIRGGYFPNDKIEETKIEIIKALLQKYLFILNNSAASSSEKIKVQLYDWLLSIAACEAEEVLDPPRKERALMDYMEDLMKERTSVPSGITEEEKNTQISIAVQKALFKLDRSIISYHLLKKQCPDWMNISQAALETTARDIYLIRNNIEKALSYNLREKFYQICERRDTPYLILGDVISEDPMAISEKIKNGEFLENKIKENYQKRLRTLKKRLSKAALLATLSILISKMLLAFAVEVPFDKYTHQFNYLTLGLNILIPSLLMCFLVLTIRPPKKENLQAVIIETIKIAYEKEKKDVYEIKLSKKRSWLMETIITAFYVFTFCLTFGLIIFGLKRINFGALSITIFLVFISLISYAGMKIRERSRELDVMEEKESVLTIFIDLFSVPVFRVGKWLSGQWVRFNIVVVLINFLIDLPFQSFVEFLEQWRYFLKEKKEEIH